MNSQILQKTLSGLSAITNALHQGIESLINVHFQHFMYNSCLQTLFLINMYDQIILECRQLDTYTFTLVGR